MVHSSQQKILEERIRELENKIKDMEEANNAQKALRESEDDFKYVFENSIIGKSITDNSGKMHANKAFSDMLGYTQDEFVRFTWRDITLPDDIETSQKVIDSLRSGEKDSWRYTKRYIHKNGSIVWTDISTVLRRDEQGKPLYFMTTVSDITEQKQMEKEIIRVSNEWQTTFDSTRSAIWVLDKNQKVIRSNRTSEQVFQQPNDQIVGKYCWEIVHGTKQPIPECPTLRVRNSLKREEMELQVGDKWFHETVDPILDSKGVYSGAVHIVMDVTNLKHAENELKESEEKFRAIFESTSDGILLADPDSKQFIMANKKICEVLGYTKDEITGLTVKDIHPDESIEYVLKEFGRLIKKEITVTEEIPVKRKDGHIFYADVSASPIMVNEKKYLLGSFRDTTKQRQSREALKKAQSQLSHAMEMAHLGHWEYDVATDTFTFNDQFYKIFGTTVEAVGGYEMRSEEYINRFIYPDDIPIVREVTQKTIKADDPDYKELAEHRIIYSDGSIRHISALIYAIKDASGKTIKTYGVNQDITDRVRAEEKRKDIEAQLRQAHKMEGIGTLAGGIAHDFNNILTPILLHSEMIMMSLDSNAPLLNDIKEIYKSAERARDLVKQILTFSRKRPEEKIVLKASLLLKEIINFLRATIPAIIEIRFDNRAEHDMVLADPTQLNQIVLNLCTNAAYAMKDNGGLLEISLENEHVPEEKANRFIGLKPGYYLKLSVKDTGTGISPQVKEKIFEPYFTTKAVGEGTGFGLAIVHSIVQSYGGQIIVDSEVGAGSTFTVYLPAKKIEIATVKPITTEIPRGDESILIVDDEKPIVNIMKKYLETIGYKVTTRTSSSEALETFRDTPDAFDLVITDMTMPVITGESLAKVLLDIKPELPVILCTGFSNKIDEKKAKEIGISAFIMKPIVMGDLARTIRKVMDNLK
ncbi:MAG: PAS domain S-box protein [Deltaproteobacteria bacterium]|nr:PAS domain S-box protein [Deltaproteobacteria bacterium]